MTESPESVVSTRRGHVAIALLSASVLLLQLVQTRLFSVMLWHHLTYLVVTFTMLGFAAGGTLVACRPHIVKMPAGRRLGRWAFLFGLSVVLAYVVVSRLASQAGTDAHEVSEVATAALDYAILVLPMVFAGMVVSLALARAGDQVGKMYAWNMIGSAFGCALFVPVLRIFGGEGTVWICVGLAWMSASLFWGPSTLEFFKDYAKGRNPQTTMGSILVGMLAVVAWIAPPTLFTIPVAPSKAMARNMAFAEEKGRPLAIELTRWDPLCRIDVVGDPASPMAIKTIYQDGDAPTVLPMGRAHETTNILDKEGLAYLLFLETSPKVLAIGIGGGIDILQAAAAKRPRPDGEPVDFTGVEINETTADLMTGLYAVGTGDRYHLPGVSVHIDEGRSWLRRSSERYDIIQMTGTDTYAALASGSYVMSESYLYTAEAYDDFLSHLTPDGVISILRFRFDPPRETLRLAAIAVDALRRDGAEHPENHLLLIGVNGPRVLVKGEEVGIDYGSLLVRKRPFTTDEVRRYRAYCEGSPRTDLLYAPGMSLPGPAGASGSDDVFRAAYPFNLEPVTDDSPFFFRYHRWENLWDSLTGQDEEDRALVEGSEYGDIVGGKPIGLIMLVTVLAESLVLVLLLVLAPLLISRREGLAVKGAGRWIAYFSCLGAGYMLVEVAAMQRFVLFLGSPSYAITVVLFTFLLFSGLGAAVAGRSDDPGRTLRRALGAVCVLLAAVGISLTTFFDIALRYPLELRMVLSVALLAPVAFVMGMPFPSGLALLGIRSSALVPWAFGVNGGASVLASVLGIMVAMSMGFSASFAAATGTYLLAWLVGHRQLRSMA